MSIKTKRISIETKITKLMADLIALQESCNHDNATHIDRASTGNYCPQDVEYWTDHACPDCNKKWRTDQKWQQTK